jgi:hypothetical protein
MIKNCLISTLNDMENISLKTLLEDKKTIEEQITGLFCVFLQKYPDVELSVDVSFSKCKSVGNGTVSICVNTNIHVEL